MNEDPLPHLEDALLRRDLTPDEKRTLTDWLTRHPEAAADWQEKSGWPSASRASRRARPLQLHVSRPLAGAPGDRCDGACPNGRPFTLVLAASSILGSSGNHRRRRGGRSRWLELADRATAGRVSPRCPSASHAGLGSQEVLEDFEVIQRFGQSAPPVDFELLAALE
jgi:hypothetical protein